MSSAVLVRLSGCLQSFQPSMNCRILIIRPRTSSLEAELAQLGATRIVAGTGHSFGRNFSPLPSVRPLLGRLAGGCRACSPSENRGRKPTVAASRSGADPWPWLMTVSAIDGVEARVLFTALRSKAVDPPGGWAFIAADAGSAAALFTRMPISVA
jgi:hypothetical protein